MNYHFGWGGHTISIYQYGDFPLSALLIEIDGNVCKPSHPGVLYNACKTWADYYTVNGRAWANMDAKDFLELVLGQGVLLQDADNPALDIHKDP